MKRKFLSLIKDCLVGIGIGCAVIIPGISAGTITIITKTFKKIVNAVDQLFSKYFFKSLLTLLPFGLVGVATVALLIKPLNIAMDACLFAIMALFAGFIAGSLPGVKKEIDGEKPRKTEVILLIIGFLLTLIVGISSLIFGSSNAIENLFNEQSFWLYFVLLIVGIVGSTGLIVPGLSGSAILLVTGFYTPVLSIGEKVISFGDDFWQQLSLLATFAFGVLIGFVLFSKLINKLLTIKKRETFFVIIGLIAGSLISIFVNSNSFAYIEAGKLSTLDWILAPILLIVGFIIAFIISKVGEKTIEE